MIIIYFNNNNENTLEVKSIQNVKILIKILIYNNLYLLKLSFKISLFSQ